MNWLATLIAYLRHAFPCLPPGEVPHVPAGPPLPAGEGPGVGLPSHGAAAPPHSQRPQRGQTMVTAGLDLRIATTSHTRTTPTGSHDGEKANPSMCDHSEVGSILGARPSAGQDLRLCKCDLSEVYGKRNTARQRPYTPRRGLTRRLRRPYTCRRHLQRRGSALPRLLNFLNAAATLTFTFRF